MAQISKRAHERLMLVLIQQCLTFWEQDSPIYPGTLFAESDIETVTEAAQRILAEVL